MPKRSNNKRRNTTRRSTRVAPSPAELEQQRMGSLEQQYEEASTYAKENSTDIAGYCEKFIEKSPSSFQFEILKHKKLVERYEKKLERVVMGQMMCRMACIVSHGDPEKLKEAQEEVKIGDAVFEDCQSQINCSQTMIKLLTKLDEVQSSAQERIQFINDEQSKDILSCLGEVEEVIRKRLECVEALCEFGSDFYSENEYNQISILYKGEYEMWKELADCLMSRQ